MFSLISFIAQVSILQLVIRALVFITLFFLHQINLPLFLLRTIHVAIKSFGYFILALTSLLIFKGNLLSLLISSILCFGFELENHLKVRTTAAYSTSDKQTQRLFNLSIFLIPLATLVSFILFRCRLFLYLDLIPTAFNSFNIPTPLTFIIKFMGIYLFIRASFFSATYASTVRAVLASLLKSLPHRTRKTRLF